MSLLKKIFGRTNTVAAETKPNGNAIAIKGIFKKRVDEIEIDFNVPSKKLYCISVITDSFTKEKKVKFIQVASYALDKLLTWADGSDFIQLNIGFRNNDGHDLIVFSTYQKTLKFKKGDKIAFLFQNQEIREFELLENGYRIDKDNEGVIIESFANISQDDLDKFRNIRLDKWRHIPCDKGRLVTGTFGYELQNDIIEMTKVYKYVIENKIE